MWRDSVVWSIGAEREPAGDEWRQQKALRVIKVHLSGRCGGCPPDDDEVCVAFRCAVRTALDAAGIPYLRRLS